MTGKSNNQKLQELRDTMAIEGVDAYLVPRGDEWQGEYVPACAERLKWLAGFTGSAGFAVVLANNAAVFSDSRYTLQMDQEVDSALFETHTTGPDFSPNVWLAKNLKTGAKIGYDPRLYTARQIEKMQEALAEKNITFVPVEGNLVDAVWDDRPQPPKAEVSVYHEAMAGKPSVEKRAEISAGLKDQNIRAYVLTAPDSIAWLLNIRGDDVPCTPFALSYAVIHDNGDVNWFIDLDKVSGAVKQHVGNHVTLHDIADMPHALESFAKDAAKNGDKIAMDDNVSAMWFRDIFEKQGADMTHMTDPVMRYKAVKNETEQKMIKHAHVKDGIALVKFWKWVTEEAPKGTISELDVADRLYKFREQQDNFVDNSFETIAGWAANGAIVHYHATPENYADIRGEGLLLVDSGAQYLEGTTDNTRTWAIGTPTDEMKDAFTRVLKGHIAVASARFGKGTTGADIDMLARQFLKKAGMDYGHGTGHGVGHFLSVHERGAGISSTFKEPLEEGMFISNEPGYYATGKFGIRLENLVFVAKDENMDSLKYSFNTVSLTPFDRNLIDMNLLDADERKWLDDYHARVYRELSPYLDQDEKSWLKAQTAPLKP